MGSPWCCSCGCQARSTITDVSVIYRKAGSTTLYRSNSTTSTLKAVGAPPC
ncbi:hypothetical protein FB459_0249 [Yimella lutea]|uniref:Uncharacterized protein n=1 Tax=Yimella lutea TaxID=587872 RepID=A0A542EC33_9MICO|nr:hypothetical protein FB459_0249 [Yimella lutea]